MYESLMTDVVDEVRRFLVELLTEKYQDEWCA